MNTPTRLLVVTAIAGVLAGCSTAGKNEAPPPKPAPVAAAPAPAPAPAPRPAPTYVVEDVHFDFDKASLKPTAVATLNAVAADLNKSPDIPYEVGGHTDSIGSQAYNQGLSERRADSVYRYLLGQGVDANRLTMRGYSETQPVAANNTAEGRAKNRRVEIHPLKN